MKTDLYERVTAQIVASLEQGVRPWLKPWNAEHAAGRITRPLRGNGIPYQGINVLMLWGAAVERGYTWAVVSCVPSADPPEAALMSYDGSSWHVNADWPYPAVKTKERWTTVLTAGPLCH